MAKINLLTIHWDNCFGAVMQTYATKKLLEGHGHQVTIINLVPRKVIQKLLNVNRIIKLYVVQDLKYLFFKRQYFGAMTRLMCSIDTSKLPAADYTIVGSDQTWNPSITQEFKYNFFLDFVEEGQKISFASSFGSAEYSGDVEKTAKLLSEFHALSVRENSGVKILKDVFNFPAIQLLDPTLGYGNYDNIPNIGIKDEPYIYPYLLKLSEKESRISQFVSDELGIKLYTRSRWGDRFSVGPVETLNNIRNASFVIVSSFHGLAFSLMFHKKFIVLCADEKKFTRLASLLELLRLEDRYVRDLDELKERRELLWKDVPYSEVDKILNSEREKIHQFITANIVEKKGDEHI